MTPIKIAPKEEVPRKKITLSIRLDLAEGLAEYCKYLGGKTDPTYVIERLLEAQLSGDKGFQAWRNKKQHD
jgi:hypothetical protein